MLEDFGIEIGTSFGPLHGKIWRIGTMGYNARKDCVLTTLAALESVLLANGAKIATNAAVPQALACYRDAAQTARRGSRQSVRRATQGRQPLVRRRTVRGIVQDRDQPLRPRSGADEHFLTAADRELDRTPL
jgi:hypothetical protein